MDKELYDYVVKSGWCWVGFFLQEMGIAPAEMTEEMFRDFNFDLETAILYKD